MAASLLAQTERAVILKELSVPDKRFIIWQSFRIDSSWLNVWLPNGELPRRENGTYLYWLADENGNLEPVRKIDFRLPIFNDEPAIYMMNQEDFIFNSYPENEPRIDIEKYRSKY